MTINKDVLLGFSTDILDFPVTKHSRRNKKMTPREKGFPHISTKPTFGVQAICILTINQEFQ